MKLYRKTAACESVANIFHQSKIATICTKVFIARLFSSKVPFLIFADVSMNIRTALVLSTPTAIC